MHLSCAKQLLSVCKDFFAQFLALSSECKSDLISFLLMIIHTFALLFCGSWSAYVIIQDLVTFKVSNHSILWGLGMGWPSLYLLNHRMQLNRLSMSVCLIFLLFGLTSVIGMGDVKLVLLIAPWLNQANLGPTCLLLLGISWLQLVTIAILKQHFPKRIAFAPSILLATVLNVAT